MTTRELAEAAFACAGRACALDRRAPEALAAPSPPLDPGRRRLGIAIGKAALAMARGAPVERGIAVVPAGGGAAARCGAGPGWRVIEAAPPEPDERSAAAGRAVRELVE